MNAGLNQRDLAMAVGVDHSTIGRYETGERPPKHDKVAAILTACSVVGEAREELLQMARDLNGSHWISIGLPGQRLQLQALLEFERDAEYAVSVSPLLIPGRLQTDEYARAIMTAAGVPEGEIEERVRIRMGRSELIKRTDRPSKFRALIGEAVLRTIIAGPDVMYRQLVHLLEMARNTAVDVRIVPASAGWHPGLEGPFLLLQFGDWQPPIVHLEARQSSLFLHLPQNVAVYEQAVHTVLRVAMSPEDSVELIATEAERFK